MVIQFVNVEVTKLENRKVRKMTKSTNGRPLNSQVFTLIIIFEYYQKDLVKKAEFIPAIYEDKDEYLVKRR